MTNFLKRFSLTILRPTCILTDCFPVCLYQCNCCCGLVCGPSYSDYFLLIVTLRILYSRCFLVSLAFCAFRALNWSLICFKLSSFLVLLYGLCFTHFDYVGLSLFWLQRCQISLRCTVSSETFFYKAIRTQGVAIHV